MRTQTPAAGGHSTVITYDNHLMTEPAASPLRCVIEAPFTKRAWFELGHTIASFPLAVGAVAFIVPMLHNGIFWAVSTDVVRKLGATTRSLARTLLGENIPAPPPLRPINLVKVATPDEAVAGRFAKAVNDAGGKARVWETKPGVTTRWLPQARVAELAAAAGITITDPRPQNEFASWAGASTAARATLRSKPCTSPACCGSASPTTASAVRGRSSTAACVASPSASAPWTAASRSTARRAAPRPSPSNCRLTHESAVTMRIVIAEDAAVIRAGLTEILADRGHEIVAAVGDANALLAAVAAHEPDVAIVDVRMPPDHTDEGLRAAITIRRTHPGIGILVFSQYVETSYAADLLSMRSGGVGYLLKDRVANVAEFADAITRVAAGGTALDPEVVAGLLKATRHTAALDALTAREHDVPP
jgi:DNA-binding NarL/FixJ family response regulator